MRRFFAVLTSGALASAAVVGTPSYSVAQGSTWTDPSPHKIGYITVARGVKLHYLDWGGTGEPLVFLTGLGNTDHSFDDIAPRFTDRFRVIAITRRGQGESSKPKDPYDIGTLARDVIAVLDSLHITAPANFAAHSFGGQELTRLAITYPKRVKKLVYLDAAFDYFVSDTAYAIAAANVPPVGGAPAPTRSDCRSVDTFIEFSARLMGIRIPEGEIRTTFVKFDTTCGRQGALADEFQTAIVGGAERQEYRRIAAPVLALCAVRDALSQEEPWMRIDSLWKANYDSVHTLYGPIDKAQRARFAREIPNAKVIEVAGAHHWIFVSHKERVITEMRAFLLAP